MRINKVKEWLKERSEKPQFRGLQTINGNLSIVIRYKDNLKFKLGQNSLVKANIEKFHEDMIHVTIENLAYSPSQNELFKQKLIVEINDLAQFLSADYKHPE